MKSIPSIIGLGVFVYTLIAGVAISEANAYEDKNAVHIGLNYVGHYGSSPFSHHTPGLQLGINRGFNNFEQFSWELQFNYSLCGKHKNHHLFAAYDLLWMFDLLRFVPYAGAGVRVGSSWLAKDHYLTAGSHATVGLDMFLSEHKAIGWNIRAGSLFNKKPHGPGRGYVVAGFYYRHMFDPGW